MRHNYTQHTPLISILMILVLCVLVACSPTRHVPEGEYLLDNVKIETDNKSIKTENLRTYIQQNPNYRIWGILPLQLTLYNFSGKDTTNALNKWLRKIGDAPVLYDEESMHASCYQLTKALSNMGYMHAEVRTQPVLLWAREQQKIRPCGTGRERVDKSM